MERLTRSKTEFNGYTHQEAVLSELDLGECLQRLSEYENTELTPSEIHLLNKFKGSQIEKLLEENRQLREQHDYWELEAKKYCAQIGEIRILAGQELCNK